MESIDPWKPRGIKIEGTAEVVDHKGMFGPGKYLKFTPKVSWSWGIKGVEPPKGEWMAKTIHREQSGLDRLSHGLSGAMCGYLFLEPIGQYHSTTELLDADFPMLGCSYQL